MKKLSFILAAAVLSGTVANAQVTADLQSQIKKDKLYTSADVDEVYGVNLYEGLNPMLEGDSTRMCDGYACNGWQTDKYDNGNVIHKGYYVEGQLKIYKNYYPDGTLEREFKSLNTFSAKSKLYHKNGQMKSEVTYVNAAPLIWQDFYDNGQLEYYEEYHKSFDYHIAKRTYYKNGKPESLFEMINKKKLEYSQNDYYSVGQKKVEGELIYDKKIYDYRKIGTWKFYAENGSLDKKESY
jgi:antitoxin component YwqK of YwqJK toxin-antitoxin module